MSTKKKIILTVLLGVLVGVLIFGLVGLIMQMPLQQATTQQEHNHNVYYFYLLGQYFDFVFKLLLRIIIVCICLYIIYNIWKNKFIFSNWSYEEYKQYINDKKIEKQKNNKAKIKNKINDLEQKLNK